MVQKKENFPDNCPENYDEHIFVVKLIIIINSKIEKYYEKKIKFKEMNTGTGTFPK